MIHQDREVPSLPAEAHRGRAADWVGLLLVGAIFVWIVMLSAAVHFGTWLVGEFLLATGISFPVWIWPLISIGQGILVLIPVLPLAYAWRSQRYRAIFQTWALSATFVLILAVTRFIPSPAVQLANLLQSALALGFAILLALFIKIRNYEYPAFDGQRFGLSLSLAVLFAYPWLAWGALGSLLDTILSLIAGLCLGLLAGLVLTVFLYRPIEEDSHGRSWDMILGGFAGGATLLLLASGFGLTGQHLLLMVILPALGWVVSGINLLGESDAVHPSLLATVALVGLAAAWPMAFVDPDELTLLLNLGSREILTWTIYAAGASVLIGWLSGMVFLILGRGLAILQRRWLIRGITSLLWLAGFGGYFLVGQPGLHGDQLFVIFTERADLSPAKNIADFSTRRQFVYDALVDQANSSQADIRRALDRLGIAHTPYYLVNGMAVEGGPLLRAWLNTRREVDRVLDNPVLRPLPAPPPVAIGSEVAPSTLPWNLEMVGADRVWGEFGVTGTGVVIGQSDSGVDGDHPDLASKYRGRDGSHDYNWFDPWNHTLKPTDINGHGTHTLGVIVGESTGVAPGAEWYACANLARGLGNPAYYLDCLQFMLAPFPLDGDPLTDGDPARSAHVLNNSWGCPDIEGCDAGTMVDAARALRAAGIFVVASAGNEGPSCESVRDPLAIYDEVLTVGAIDDEGALAFFSSLGPVVVDGSGRTKPDIVAPGDNIVSTFPNGSYEALPGTSFSGPHVAGVVALMWSANSDLMGNVSRTEQILTDTARRYDGPLPGCVVGSTMPNNAVGYGVVDAYAAVERALSEN